jgi:hypothetical protein
VAREERVTHRLVYRPPESASAGFRGAFASGAGAAHEFALQLEP